MPDVFSRWRDQDIRRAGELARTLFEWVGYLRHDASESIDNEKALTRALSEHILAFNNERLAAPGQAGIRLAPAIVLPSIVLDDVLTGADVDKLLDRAIPRLGERVRRVTLDSNYYLCNKQAMAMYLGWSAIDKLAWVRDRHDCDNFAIELFAEFGRLYRFQNIGIVVDWSSGHAYAFAMFADGEVWWIEPQSDERIKIGTPPYKLENALIII